MAYVTDERVAALTDKLEAGIKDLFASGRYDEYLRVMSKFHHYSFGNAMLIFLQCPTATHVAGYGKWKEEFGRNVKRGEKGIQILAPCPYRRIIEQDPDDPEAGQKVVSVTRFKIATVFDVSQTEGRELPTLASELTGDVQDFQSIFDRLTAYAPVPVEYDHVPSAAKGYFSPTEHRIVLRPGMSEVQTIKTLVHEIAHAKLHDPENVPQEEHKARREKEVEAESVAYVVCQHFGIDTSDYSFGYVAGWSSNKELSELKESLDVIHTTAAEIIDTIQPQLLEISAPERSKNIHTR